MGRLKPEFLERIEAFCGRVVDAGVALRRKAPSPGQKVEGRTIRLYLSIEL
jgi:hypothetical protein